MGERKPRLGRRDFIKSGAAGGVGAAALVGLGPGAQDAAAQGPKKWDRVADVVVVGAGASGLPACIMARDQGATVIVIDENSDIGGHGMVSGGNIPLGGGTSFQKKYGIEDSADQVYLDHTDHKNPIGKWCDRDLIRVWADENAPTFEFLVDNGVEFIDKPPRLVNDGTVPRAVTTVPSTTDPNATLEGRVRDSFGDADGGSDERSDCRDRDRGRLCR